MTEKLSGALADLKQRHADLLRLRQAEKEEANRSAVAMRQSIDEQAQESDEQIGRLKVFKTLFIVALFAVLALLFTIAIGVRQYLRKQGRLQFFN